MTEQAKEENEAPGGQSRAGEAGANLTVGLCPQKMAWEQRYSDDSGVSYAVRYDAVDLHYDGCAKIQIEAIDKADLPVTQLDWLIACLCKIREELRHNDGV